MSETPVYIELTATVVPLEPFRDVFIAQLGKLGFDSFTDTENGFQAYILKDRFSSESVVETLQWNGVDISCSLQEIEQVNWNAEWEKNFDPIDVDGRVYIYAPFHTPKQGYEHLILIEPKMSFGTGHHQTTQMMIQWTLELPTEGLRVLDMGCGTGILGILAGMRGASHIDGIDIDTWCVENTLENTERNSIAMSCKQGGAEAIKDTYDLIYANINLNVLLADMDAYVAALVEGGTILFSGFYEENVPALRERAEAAGLTYEGMKGSDHWRSVKMRK
ncbi:MAG: 50S ribosomal protein L11 methyltransferase [Flavobacteriales bacterium]|nr:50S ribosomal protein L11 methyltransferase [Cryomorphaceae bacterium]|tara:strand:+ start:6670 stop:7500 length:831 start_codon:yes stop_codon:yes gene_type:complete